MGESAAVIEYVESEVAVMEADTESESESGQTGSSGAEGGSSGSEEGGEGEQIKFPG